MNIIKSMRRVKVLLFNITMLDNFKAKLHIVKIDYCTLLQIAIKYDFLLHFFIF